MREYKNESIGLIFELAAASVFVAVLYLIAVFL